MMSHDEVVPTVGKSMVNLAKEISHADSGVESRDLDLPEFFEDSHTLELQGLTKKVFLLQQSYNSLRQIVIGEEIVKEGSVFVEPAQPESACRIGNDLQNLTSYNQWQKCESALVLGDCGYKYIKLPEGGLKVMKDSEAISLPVQSQDLNIEEVLTSSLSGEAVSSNISALTADNKCLQDQLEEKESDIATFKMKLVKRVEAGLQLEQSGERSMEEAMRSERSEWEKERKDLQDEVDQLRAELIASKEREGLLQAETDAFELQVQQYRADLSAERKDREAAAGTFADREKVWMEQIRRTEEERDHLRALHTQLQDGWMEEIRRAGENRGHSDPTGQLQEESPCQRNETVGDLNTSEQHGSDFGTHALKALIPLFYDMPHEAILSRNCWIPFGHDSITVDRRGGSYDLCSDGLTKLTVPRNAVRGETAQIRYAIIGRGPFQLPPNYQLGSFVVYVYYNPEKITTPVTLSLPSWYGGDVVPGEPPPDGLSFAVAPHTLGLKDTQYTFRLVDGGEFHDSRVHDVSIDGHSSLYTIAFKEGAKSLYLATHLTVKNNAEKNTYRIYVTYFSPIWIKILKDIHKRVEFNVDHQQFYFQKPSSDSPSDPLSGKLVCEVKDTTGNGWAVAIEGCPELRQTEVSYEECGFTTAEDLEGAVEEGLYPPNLTLTVVNNVGGEEHATPKLVNCTIQGADRPLQFSINVWERRGPSSPSSPTPSLYIPQFKGQIKEFLKLYKESMLDRIVAKEIADKLFDKSLLPESVVTSIRNANSEYKANSILWSHASKHYEFQSCLTLCVVMEKENGYPKMAILGTKMRKELEKYKDEYIACDDWMMEPD